MKQPCIDCGTPTTGTRCELHNTRHQRSVNRTAQIRRASNGRSPYDRGTYRTQAAAVRATATTCHICGEGPRPNDPWQADHVIPISKGGEVGPLAAAHRSCNISRANKLRAGKPDIAHTANKRKGDPARTNPQRPALRGNPAPPPLPPTPQHATHSDTPNHHPDETQTPAGDNPHPPQILYS
jgi:5-methylcytosine-specific restriction endonuclease McrA